MIHWLSRDLIVSVHDRQLAEHGGSAGIRDENLLESAMARPLQVLAYSGSEPDLCELAASLTFGLARNHPFVDANKRTAILSCELFLELNDAELMATDMDVYPVILSLAEGHMPEDEFAEWLRQHTRSTADQVQEPAGSYR